jgi:hypothetical protein
MVMLLRTSRNLSVWSSDRRGVHTLNAGLFHGAYVSDGYVQVIQTWSFQSIWSMLAWALRYGWHVRIHRRNDRWWPAVAGLSKAMIPHLRSVHQHLWRMMRMLLVLRHRRMLCWWNGLMLLSMFTESWCRKSGMMDGAPWLLLLLLLLLLLMGVMLLMVRRCIVRVVLLAVVASMRVMTRIVHTEVSYSIVARQRVADAWVPPERTALDGRRAKGGKNWN